MLGLKNKPLPGQTPLLKFKGIQYNLAGKDLEVEIEATASAPAHTRKIKGATQEDLQYLLDNLKGADQIICQVDKDGNPVKKQETSFTKKDFSSTTENK